MALAGDQGSGSLTRAQRRFWQRAHLGVWMAAHAVGHGFSGTLNDLDRAVRYGVLAVAAKEHGFVAEADYQTLTGPIDAGLAMPTGY